MPTRSKGCRVCVRRHLRCDLTRPTCLRCRSSGLECDGYAAQWIDETERTTTRFRLRSGPSTSRTSSVSSARRRTSSTPISPSDERRPTLVSAAGALSLRQLRETPRCYPVISDVPLSLSTYSDDVYCTFFLDKFFSFGFYSDTIHGNKAWIFDTLQVPSGNPVANVALRCLIRGFFGRVHRDQDLQVEASRLYSEGLIALRDLLGVQPSAMDGFDLLAATTLLLQYECLAHTTLGGFIKHARGLRSVIESRGPRYFLENKRARCLFAWSKQHIHIESLRSCERSFLERAEWKAVSAADAAESETLLWATSLAELAVNLSGLFEDIKLLKDSLGTSTRQFEELNDSFQQLGAALQAWWEGFCSDASRMPTTTTILPPEVDLLLVTDTFVRFANLAQAHTFCSYHAYQILTLAWSRRLRQLQPTEDNQPLSEAGGILDANARFSREDTELAHRERLRPHAMAICDALPNFALPQYRHIGGLLCAFPARVAWQARPGGSEEAEWVKYSLEKMSEASGFQLIRNICRPL